MTGEVITDASERLVRWKDHFENLLNFPAPVASDLINTDQTTTETYDINCEPPNADEIAHAITCLKNNKAPGEDSLPAEIYKCCSEALVQPLQRLFSQIWRQEAFPQNWRDALLLPFFKKGDRTLCSNYRGISLLDVAAKLFAILLLKRFQHQRDLRTRRNQAGFRVGRGCLDQLFSIRRLLEHRSSYQQPTIICFIDFTAAFDSVHRTALWRLMELDGVPVKIINLLKAYYNQTRANVQVYGEVTETFPVRTGVRQGCVLSPILFNFTIDWILRNALSHAHGVELAPGKALTDLDYADDVALFTTNISEMQSIMDRVDQYASTIGMNISLNKTKILYSSIPDDDKRPLLYRGSPIEEVSQFKYLGSIISSTGQAGLDIDARINSARTAFAKLQKTLWCRKEIRLQTKVRIYQAMVRTVLLYGCECWQLRVDDIRRLEVFDHWCLRRMLGIQWDDHTSNADIRQKCLIRCLSTTIQERRLRWLGHVLRKPPDEVVSICLHTSPCTGWKKRPGGQRKTWLDLIKEDMAKIAGPTVYGLRRWNRDWLCIACDLASDRAAWRAATRDILEAG
ncbi:MAG: reverse transcriptase family protein [Pseudomonadota bacterium]|nr:reverse transcriptase family protein [Pseudomonadota bacterium]